ncbi:hypothetical protein A2Y85_07030 [candidate division WOR-3 bacterium RBG_13_43_14]|uniref:Uncharacterized protein n=1 Tax=candidate division WOR-3 bacterium RBG_13_43_14 TaxID=1802590 RepID=A0A1F4UAN5_UNCW3|nr:MAG: hypothetical protein A2Y85_07030 [candidate division WOR-3 bacterium RBG_13_43_14]
MLDKGLISNKMEIVYQIAEEKQATTSTLNQTNNPFRNSLCTHDGFEKYRRLFVYISNRVNALKFYYGTMLRKKFIYEVKRPRKDR